MTALLEQVFARVSQLSDEEQDMLASWLLAEMDAEDAFDRRIEETAGKLVGLAEEALREYHAGQTEELFPEES